MASGLSLVSYPPMYPIFGYIFISGLFRMVRGSGLQSRRKTSDNKVRNTKIGHHFLKLITSLHRKHDPVTLEEVQTRVRDAVFSISGPRTHTSHCAQVKRILSDGLVTTKAGTIPIGVGVKDVSICVHSDSPVCQFSLLYWNLSEAISRTGSRRYRPDSQAAC